MFLTFMCRSISNYFLILMKILKQDIVPFLVVFGMVLFATSGALYLEQNIFKAEIPPEEFE